MAIGWFEFVVAFLPPFVIGPILRTWFRAGGYRTSFWPALAALLVSAGWEAALGGLSRLTSHAPPLLCGFLASWAWMFFTRKRSWTNRERFMPRGEADSRPPAP